MLQLTHKPAPEKEKHSSILKERGRLVIALSLLVVALAVVIVKDREFWFDSEDAPDSEVATSESTPKAQQTPTPAPAPAKTAQAVVAKATVAPVAAPKKHAAPKTATAKAAIPEKSHPTVAKVEPAAPATSRASVPPLAVEVIAGDKQSLLHPGSAGSKVEILKDTISAPAAAAPAAGQPKNAAENERLASADMTYPLLGQHTKVQGSVVLQALVGTDGNIMSLRVLSGPAILAIAAQQAVRQWHFKPYMQNGQPVETKATVIVNFSIRVADNPTKTS
ncbi:MAG: TonB family protein [Candidatus Sulfotelmatobacter sp.]